MGNRIKLIDYLPKFIQEYQEIQAITSTEQEEVDIFWDEIDVIRNNNFIETSNEYGISRYESIIGITPLSTQTLDERKDDIIIRINEQLPYSYRVLENMLKSICGEDYSINLENNIYKITIRISLVVKTRLAVVMSMLDRVLPANLVKVLDLMYNTHSIVSNYTHGQLSLKNHEEIRSEVLN